MNFKVGEQVAYLDFRNLAHYYNKCEVGIGMVYYENDDCVRIINYPSNTILIDKKSTHNRVFKINENTKFNMLKVVEEEIIDLKMQIKNLTVEEKDEIKKVEFNRIKEQILNTVKNMIDSDETSFLNQLKEVCRLKNQIYSIKISDLDNIHKHNGGIKYKIKGFKDLLEKIENLEIS